MESKNTKLLEYKYTGTLDVVKTVREIRDEKIKQGGYKGHSKYLWDALELRNKGYDNREIAKELTSKYGVDIQGQYIKQMFDGYGIESNPSKYKAAGRVKVDIVIMDRETFNKVDIESLKSGVKPAKIMKDILGGKIGDMVYDTEYLLQKVWDASYAYYINE